MWLLLIVNVICVGCKDSYLNVTYVNDSYVGATYDNGSYVSYLW